MTILVLCLIIASTFTISLIYLAYRESLIIGEQHLRNYSIRIEKQRDEIMNDESLSEKQKQEKIITLLSEYEEYSF